MAIIPLIFPDIMYDTKLGIFYCTDDRHTPRLLDIRNNHGVNKKKKRNVCRIERFGEAAVLALESRAIPTRVSVGRALRIMKRR